MGGILGETFVARIAFNDYFIFAPLYSNGALPSLASSFSPHLGPHHLHWNLTLGRIRDYAHVVKTYRDPSLGLATKAKGCEVMGQEGDLGVTSHAPRSAKNVKERTLTLPSELPCWGLESQMDAQIFKMRLQGSKPIGLKIFYIIGKLLKLKCLKCARIAHLDI